MRTPSDRIRACGRALGSPLLALLCAALALACGPTAAPPAAAPAASGGARPAAGKPASVADLAAYQAADRQQVLEAGARQEGKLTWYTSLSGPIIDRLLAAYRDKYPAVETEVYRAAENDLLTKATQEAQAGKQVFDVIETPPSAIRLLEDAGLLTPYYSPALARFPDMAKTPAKDGLVDSALVRISYIGFGYNTTLIPESAVPKTAQDLLNPGLTGKLALAGTTTGERWAASVLHGMGDERGRAFLQQVASQQKPVVHQISGKALLDLIAKGEVAASPTIFRDHVLQAQAEQNAPVKWVPLDPVVGNAGQGALAAKAPHPNAALLFLDYLYSDGQQLLEDNYYSTGATQVSFTPWNPEQGKTAAQIDQDATQWNSTFNTIFRGR
ncbi:MAG TPA: extracellular solute-binding protein [Chloroflexota bacterium]|jgi:iron(III) transport system substrate-binding protein